MAESVGTTSPSVHPPTPSQPPPPYAERPAPPRNEPLRVPARPQPRRYAYEAPTPPPEAQLPHEPVTLGLAIAAGALVLYVLEELFTEVQAQHRLGVALTVGSFLASLYVTGLLRRRRPVPHPLRNELLRSLREAAWATLAMVGVVAGARLLYMELLTPEASFFQWRCLDSSYVSYLWVAPLQEATVRGLWQARLHAALPRAWASWPPIAAVAFLFFVFHLPYGGTFALGAAIVATIAGVLFRRTGNLVGVCLFHTVLGLFLGATGFWEMVARSSGS